MTVGRRCSNGCAVWPDDEAFEICPVCREDTTRFRGLTPLSHEKAESRRKHADFDHYDEEEHIKDVAPLSEVELNEMGISAD
jgi:hypothetical protein